MNRLTKHVFYAVLCGLLLQSAGMNAVESKPWKIQRLFSWAGGCVKNYWKPVLKATAVTTAIAGVVAYLNRGKIAAACNLVDGFVGSLLTKCNNQTIAHHISKGASDQKIKDLLFCAGDDQKCDALCYAIKENNFHAIKLLVEYGVDVNRWGYADLCDIGGHNALLWKTAADYEPVAQSPLSWAIEGFNVSQDVVKYLVNHGAVITNSHVFDAAKSDNALSINYLLAEKKKQGKHVYDQALNYAYFGACEGAQLEQIKNFIVLVACPNSYSALCCAAKGGRVPVVNYLVETLKLDVDPKSPASETALGVAAENGNLEVVDYLLAHNAKVDLENMFHYTALKSAVRKYCFLAQAIKKERGLDINKLTVIIKRLVEHGADISDEMLRDVKDLEIYRYLKLARDFRLVIAKKLKLKIFVKRHLSSQQTIEQNIVDVISLADRVNIYKKIEKIWGKMAENDTKLTIANVLVTKKQVKTNFWYMLLLRLAADANNVLLAQKIIATQTELWPYAEKYFESACNKEKGEGVLIDEKRFSKPLITFMRTKQALSRIRYDKKVENKKYSPDDQDALYLADEVVSHILDYLYSSKKPKPAVEVK